MLLRRATPLAIAIAALACEPSVPFDPATHNPSTVDYAAFDPTGNPPAIPLPNDLAFQPQAISTQNASQAALLNAFRAAGGFPNDQEVPITIDFVRETLDPNTGAQKRSTPPIDTTSINPSTLLIIGKTSSGSGAVAYDAPKPADYVVNGDHGTLTLHKSPDLAKSGSRRFAPGQYIVAVRGGANGVKVTGSTTGLQPQAAMYLLLQGQDLSLPQNQGLIPGNTRADKATTAAQLEALRKLYLAPFAAIDASGAFSSLEIATMTTFTVAPLVAHVETDPGAGLMPLPSDFLFANGHLLPQLADPVNGPFKQLGPGLATLDGFSTTAMVLSQTSAFIDAKTVNGSSVFLYELNLATKPPTARRLVDIAEALGAGHPERTEYVSEPSQISQAALSGGACSAHPTELCASPVIGLQPAVPALVGSTFVPVPPLKEGTTYVVLVTDKVKDINGAALGRSTLGRILLLDPSLTIADSKGKSQISGVTDAQAVGLDQMRGAIALAAGTLAAEKGSAYGRDHIEMAYTFKTQTMKSTAVNLTALPYSTPSSGPTSTIVPVGTPKLYGTCLGVACPDGTVANVFDAYGVDIPTVPNANIGTIVEANIITFNGLDDTTGAFKDLTKVQPALEVITALIALPNLTCLPTATTPCSIPLVVFRHGFGGGRGDMLTLANTFNAQGIAVAAIDANKHGDRSFCSANSQCAGGSTCQAVASMANQGDPAGATPGRCAGGATPDFVRRPVLCPTAGCTTATLTKGIPIASSTFLVGANIFRTRDTLRQDLIDESQLIRVLSPNPACDPAALATDPLHTCANQVITASTGFQIDRTKIWFVGLSLGSISGTIDVAANPRIGKAAFSVGGGTIADIFTTSPSFAGPTNALLASLGIAPGTAAYLQFLNVSKWILDPADPVNFATNLIANPLASPLSGGVAPPGRKVLAQISNCDLTVPNPFNLEADKLTGLGPTSSSTSTLEILTNSGDYSSIGQTSCAVTSGSTTVPVPEAVAGAGAVPHGILLDWGVVGGAVNATLKALTLQLQTDFQAFLSSDTQPPPVR
jgi:hypothetical protein